MRRDWAAIEQQLRAALARAPDDARLAIALGEALLAQGRFAEGFRGLARWRDVPELRAQADMDFPIPRWSGGPVAGKRFLVVSREGLGDQILYARFARWLAEQGAEVHWLCPQPLVRVLQRCLGVTAIPGVGVVQLGEYDLFCPSSDLAAGFFPPLEAPPDAAYLDLPKPSVVEGLTVGVVTHGNPKHVNDAARSLPDALRSELTSLPGAVDLKPENTGARDLHDTAQIIAGLDLVISVDTSVAHLAAALGRPVWVLVPAGIDWRWEGPGERSWWYASGRVLRQPEPGDWGSVLAEVRRRLGR